MHVIEWSNTLPLQDQKIERANACVEVELNVGQEERILSALWGTFLVEYINPLSEDEIK